MGTLASPTRVFILSCALNKFVLFSARLLSKHKELDFVLVSLLFTFKQKGLYILLLIQNIKIQAIYYPFERNDQSA